MQMNDLRVLHLRKNEWTDPRLAPVLAPTKAFKVETCQRNFWVFPHSSQIRRIGAEEQSPFDLYEGRDAYWFLLQVSTGLASQVKGETDIFGQLKEAWSQYEKGGDPEVRSGLRPWIQKIFEDTKEIRSNFLQNIGGASYGSLVRQLLRENESSRPVLLIGAGQLAESVAPWLADRELIVWNRSKENAFRWAALFQVKTGKTVTVLDHFDDHLRALEQGAEAVFCIPPDSEHDKKRVAVLRNSAATVIHLGLQSARETPWNQLPGVKTLEEIFALQKKSETHREDRFLKAEEACAERTRLRELCSYSGGSISLAHGWEDLALFERMS